MAEQYSKNELRKRMKAVEAEFLLSGQAIEESQRILSKLESTNFFADAQTILCYMDIPGEVMITKALDFWLNAGKSIVLPKVVDSDLELRKYCPEAMQSGYRAILEPSDACPIFEADSVDLVIVPGLAFSFEQGQYWRMGRGAGYYDRLLKGMNCPKIGICYPFRFLPTIPRDPWDQALDGVIC